MGEPAMKEAQAQEQRIDVRAVQQAYENLTTHFTAIRGTFTQMQEAGITPVQVTYTDANVRRLLAALVQLDQRLRPSNGGQAVIPISGSTDRDKFRSMNTWLGRGRDAALDAAGLQLLEQRVMAALGTPSADSSVGPILAQVTPTATPAPVVAQPTETARPSAREAVPARVEAPEPATAAAPQHGQLRDNLETIVTYGRNARARRSAEQALTRLNAELNRTGGPRERQLGRLVTAAERVVSSELARAQTRAAASRMESVPGVDSARAHPLSQRVTSILTDLQAVAADQSVSQARRDLANNLIGRLNDALLLGEDPASRMVTRIGEARDALQAGNETLARTKATAANTIYTAEQQFMRQRLEQFVVPIAQSALTAIDASHLPTRAELATAARADGVSRGTYDYVPVRDSRGRIVRRVRTGKEDVRATMTERLTRARAMLQAAQGGGDLSHHTVTELFQSVTLEERSIRTIIDLYDVAHGSNIDQLPLARRTQLRRQYAFAVTTLLDSDFIPYTLYSADTRRSMARVYLRMTGGSVTDAQVRRAERELLPALMRSRDFRYEDVLHKLYLEVSRLAPAAPSGTTAAVRTMATMRRLRPLMRAEYLPYVIGMRWEIAEGQRLPATLTPDQLQHQDRLTMARGFLEEAVRTSGLPATDPLIQAANAWVAHAQTVQAADVPRVSDTLYNMAMSLTAIREAQLWRANRSLRRDLSSTDQTRADSLIQQAQRMFVWCFSTPQVDSGFHPNLAGNIADVAINLMAPVALQATESPAMLATLAAYDAPATQDVTLADPANPTAAESAQGAQTAEERFIRLLASVRGNSRFGVSAYEGRPASSRRAFALLEPMVGRNPTIQQLVGHPILRKSSGRGRTTVSAVDQHVVPAPNPTEAALANNHQEDLGLAHYGQLYMELYRLTVLRGNSETPEILRTIDPAPLRGRMWQISRGYATATPTETVAAANGQLISILDTRLGELRSRLDGEILLASGNRFPRRDLARSRDPRVMQVTRAVEAERVLTTLRAQLHRDRGSDLFTGRMNPRLAIAVSEMAIASLDDDVIRRFPDPEQQGRLTDDLATLSFYVPRTSIELERYSRGSSRRVRFTAEQVMVREADGDTMSFADFHRRYQRQHQRQVNLTYYWFAYQNLGRRDSEGNPIQYLRNPQYDPTSTVESRRRAYVGQAMSDVVLTDGTRIGRAVVRVRPSGLSPTEGPEWAPVVDGRGRVRSADVLFRLEGDTLAPVRDARLERSLSSVCTPTDHNQSWTYERGESTPVVIVSPRSTSPTAAARRSR